MHLSTASSSNSSDEYLTFSDLCNQDQIVIVGHRGGFLPENTLKAFEQAKLHKL